MTTASLSINQEPSRGTPAGSSRIEAIPLPFASVSFSDTYHRSLLANFGIDGGLAAFSRPDNTYYISSAVGLPAELPRLEPEVSCLCQMIDNGQIKVHGRVLSLRPLLANLPVLSRAVEHADLRFLRVFKINDLLSSNGYWLLFFRKHDRALRVGEMISRSLYTPPFSTAALEPYGALHREETLDERILGWVRLLDRRDKETEEHTRRVADLAVRLGQACALSQKQLKTIYRGALVHDVGKLVIPDKILLKPGPLTPSEWKLMRLHPGIARDLLQNYAIPDEVLEIPYAHHERWDGGGYPNGLEGEAIPLSARIFSIVDVWDAMLVDRPYRKRFPRSEVIGHIREQAGRHFDPRIAAVFFEMIAADS